MTRVPPPSWFTRRLAMLSAAFLALTPACGPGVKRTDGAPTALRTVRILATTDGHGHWDRPDDPGATGGARALAVRVASERQAAAEAGRGVLLLDGGDVWSGTLLGDTDEGRTGVALYDTLGYDAIAVGNHEFDFGPEGPPRVGTDRPFGALRARIAQSRSPFLVANLVDRATGAAVAWEGLATSKLVTSGGVRVGLVGLITEETPDITFGYVGASLRFTSAAEALTREAKALRRAGAEVVVAVGHIGGECRAFDDPEDLSVCDLDSEAFALARALEPGLVDAIVGGHTHKPVAHRVAGVAVIQSGRYFDRLAMLDLVERPSGGFDTRVYPPQRLPQPTEALLADPTVRALHDAVDAVLAPAEAAVETMRARQVGATVAEPITRDHDAGSPMGALVCDSLLARFEDREICLANSGGLRRDLPAGPLSYGALYDALPFGNSVAFIDLPGRVLLEVLQVGTSGAHGLMQVGGLRVRFDPTADPCPTTDRSRDGRVDGHDRMRLVEATLADGTPIVADRVYRLVTSSFLADGGDGLGGVWGQLPRGAVQIRDDVPPIREQLAALFEATTPTLGDGTSPPSMGHGAWQERVAPTVAVDGHELTPRCPR